MLEYYKMGDEIFEMMQELILTVIEEDKPTSNFKRIKESQAKWSLISKERDKILCDVNSKLSESHEKLTAEVQTKTVQLNNRTTECVTLESQIAETRKRKEEIEAHIHENKTKHDSVKRTISQLEQEGQQKMAEKKKKTLALRDELSLLKLSTGVKLGKSTNSEEVKGIVCNKLKVEPFCLSRKEHADVHITNTLWDMMQSDW